MAGSTGMVLTDYIRLNRLVRITPAPDNRRSCLPLSIMIGRLLKFFVICVVLYAVARWLLNRRQKETLRELFHSLATALLIASALSVGWYLWLGHR